VYTILRIHAEVGSIYNFVAIFQNGQGARGGRERHSRETGVSFTVRYDDRYTIAYVVRMSDTHDKSNIYIHLMCIRYANLNEENWVGHVRDAFKVVAKSRGFVY
jgi:hypothetical protein